MVLTSSIYESEQFNTIAVFEPDKIFRQFFEYLAAVLQFRGRIYWEWPAKCAGWSSVELRDFGAQQKIYGRDLFLTACDSCSFAKEKTICWNIIVGNSADPILVSKSTWVSSVTESRTRVENEHMRVSERESPVAMIRRLVDGFVHDLRPRQLRMFLSEADRLLSASPAVLVAPPAHNNEDSVLPAERERVRKLIHRLHVAGGHVSKTSLRLLLAWLISCSVIRVSNPVMLRTHNESRCQRLQNCGRH